MLTCSVAEDMANKTYILQTKNSPAFYNVPLCVYLKSRDFSIPYDLFHIQEREKVNSVKCFFLEKTKRCLPSLFFLPKKFK